MKQVKARKVISIGFAVLFALSGLLVLLPVSVFAAGTDTYINFSNNTRFAVSLYANGVLDGTISGAADNYHFYTHTSNVDSFSAIYSSRYLKIYYNDVELSTDPNNPTIMYLNYSSVLYIEQEYSSSAISYYVTYEIAYTPDPSTPTPDPSTPSPTPTASPSPTPSPTPSVDTFFSPFKSFAGTYYNDTALFFPNSVTKHQYAQYSGIVSDHNMTITDIRSTLQFNAGNYVVYKFEYDILPLTSADFRFDFLFDSDSDLPSVYVSYLFNGQVYECEDFEQTYLTGIYTQYGAFDIDPSQTIGPPFYAWDVDLTSQRSLGVEIDGLKHDNTSVTPITITLYISSTPMPGFGSSFDWAQLFEDTRPDSAFLTTVSSLSSLPFFVGGLGFLALGAVIGIVLKFMR